MENKIIKMELLVILLLLLILTALGVSFVRSQKEETVSREYSEVSGVAYGMTPAVTEHPTATVVPMQELTAAPTETPVTVAPTNTPTPKAAATPTNTSMPTATPTPSGTPTPTPKVIDITISAAGDVTLGVNQKQEYAGSFDEYYDLHGENYFMENVKAVFESDDFTIVNLEGVLTTSENIRLTKEWNMKGRPEYARILSNASVEAVSLGNNHIMDYEWDGVNDTFQTVTENGMVYAISSPWGDRYGMYETEEGIQIGFVSVNEYYDGNNVYTWLEEGYQELREAGADLMIACMHWGGDKVYEPEPEQYEIGHWLIDQGYDLVVGCHPHVIQGIECYNGKYIVHSMGNFCYGGNKNPSDKDSMIFQQTFTFVDGVLQEDTTIRAIPCSLSSVTWRNDFRPRLLVGEEAAAWAEKMNQLSVEFGLQFDEQGYLVEDISTDETETQ